MVNISITFAGVTNLIDYRRVMKAGFSHFFVSRVLHIILFARLSVWLSDSTPSLSMSLFSLCRDFSVSVCLSGFSLCRDLSVSVLAGWLADWQADWLAGWLTD